MFPTPLIPFYLKHLLLRARHKTQNGCQASFARLCWPTRRTMLAIFIALLCVGTDSAALTFIETLPVKDDSYGVFWVRNFSNQKLGFHSPQAAAFGETIEVEVKDLNSWISSRISKMPKLYEGRTLEDAIEYRKTHLCLIINGEAFEDIKPDRIEDFKPLWPYHRPDLYNPSDSQERKTAIGKKWDDSKGYTLLRFTLTRTDADYLLWCKLLSAPQNIKQRIEVSIGFKTEDGVWYAIPSWVRRPVVVNEIDLPQYDFSIQFSQWTELCFWMVLIFLSLVLLSCLAHVPGVLRDPFAPVRPDGLQPYSLARLQMVCWLYIIVCTYLLLWKVTGRIDTLSASATILLGISAFTAVGSGVIGANLSSSNPPTALLASDIEKMHPYFWDVLLAPNQRKRDAYIKDLKEKITNASAKDRKSSAERLQALDQAERYFKTNVIFRFMKDLIMDGPSANPGRFQMLVWTAVLAGVFIYETWSKLKMPEFDNSVLALMGISSGAYLGFKQQGK